MLHVNDSNFKASIPSVGVALVDFTATWCPPCKTLLSILEELEDELGPAVRILKLDVEESPAAAAEFGILSMPTVMLFKDGQPVDKLVGLRSKQTYRNLLDRQRQ